MDDIRFSRQALIDSLNNRTDRMKVSMLLKDLGIGYVDMPLSIDIENDQENVEGYNGFMTVFNFDEDEKFTVLGIWE